MNHVRLHCVVCKNSIDYFKYLLNNYRSLASLSASLKIYAHCTDDESFCYFKNNDIADVVVDVHRQPKFFMYANRADILNRIKFFFTGKSRLGGSSGHGAGLNSAFFSSGGDGFDIIADTDTVIVVKNWDIVLSKLLDSHAIIGTSYEEKGGATSGNNNVQTYKTAPNLTWVAFSSKFPFNKLDASHVLWKNLPIKTQSQADLYGLKIGDFLLRDVGWKIAPFLKKHNASSLKFDHTNPESGKSKVLKIGNAYNEEFQLNGVPFILHQRGSRKHAFKSEPLSAPFYLACEDYLKGLE